MRLRKNIFVFAMICVAIIFQGCSKDSATEYDGDQAQNSGSIQTGKAFSVTNGDELNYPIFSSRPKSIQFNDNETCAIVLQDSTNITCRWGHTGGKDIPNQIGIIINNYDADFVVSFPDSKSITFKQASKIGTPGASAGITTCNPASGNDTVGQLYLHNFYASFLLFFKSKDYGAGFNVKVLDEAKQQFKVVENYSAGWPGNLLPSWIKLGTWCYDSGYKGKPATTVDCGDDTPTKSTSDVCDCFPMLKDATFTVGPSNTITASYGSKGDTAVLKWKSAEEGAGCDD